MKKVYAIRNKINGKMYIGSTRQYKDNRWKKHLKDLQVGNHYSEHLQRAWNKYGEENFEYIILENIIQEDDQFEREQYWIDKYEVYKPEKGYNGTKTAGRVEMTEEVKQKISHTMKGRPLSPQHIKAFAEGRRGGHLKESTRKKISDAHTGKILSNEHKEAIGKKLRGMSKSEETKKRMKQAASNRSKEHLKNMAVAKEKRKSLTNEIIYNILEDKKKISNKALSEKYGLNTSMLYRICKEPEKFLK